jgi:hypothetical protein
MSAEFCTRRRSEMVTMPNERTNDARTDLRSWYLHSLQPKLARAATTGAVDPQAVAALDAEVRSFLDLHRARTTGVPAGAIMAEVKRAGQQSEVTP